MHPPPQSPWLQVGRYGVFHEIASGGMATVHLGRQLGDAGFGRTVAIKRMHPHLAKEPEFVHMFLDEARLVARIRHPHVVSTLDVVVEGPELLLVMEYVEGESLARLVAAARKRGEPVPLPVILGVMVGALRGMHAAHEARDELGNLLGVVHRDVSPQNIQVGVDGVARVLDFGVAKARGRLQTTSEGQLKGKPAYMSPEQLLGDPVDRRTDVFAASIVLWELLTGRRLFRGETEAETLRLVLDRFIDPPSRVASCPASLDAIVMRGLARELPRRWETARDMAAALEAAERCAPASEIEAWVRSLASDALATRGRQLAEIETASVQPARVAAPRASGAAGRAESARGGASPRTVAMLVIGILGASSAAFVAGSRLGTSRPAADAASATPAASAAPPPPPPELVAVASAAPSAAASAAPPEPSSAPTASGAVRPAARAPARSCQPPYVVDARGIKHPKPECYR